MLQQSKENGPLPGTQEQLENNNFGFIHLGNEQIPDSHQEFSVPSARICSSLQLVLFSI